MKSFQICERVFVQVVDLTFYFTVDGVLYQSTLNPFEYIGNWNLLISHTLDDVLEVVKRAWDNTWGITPDETLIAFSKAEKILCNYI